MKKLALGMLFAAIAACGGGNNNKDALTVDDGNTVDAPPACNVFGAPGNQGCNTGEKCTWVIDSGNADTGHLGCAPDGAGVLGATCAFPHVGSGSSADVSGADDCAAGGFCISHRCEAICDPVGSAEACATGFSCGTYIGLFSSGTPAGVCDPTCNPLTQDADAPIDGKVTACGSTIPCNGPGSADGSGSGSAQCGSDGPSFGCYPALFQGVATCTNTPESRGKVGLTDKQPCTVDMDCAQSTSMGDAPFINGCAPGYSPLFFENGGSTQVTCSGLCAPANTDTGLTANGLGDGSALGKIPTDVTPVAGHSRCAINIKGSTANQECKFLWPDFIVNNVTDDAYNDTVGACFRPADFDYDPTGGSNFNTPEPLCSTLKPGLPGSNAPANVACANDPTAVDCFAVAHQCYSFASTPMAFGGGSADAGSAAFAGHFKLTTRGPTIRNSINADMKFRRTGGIRN